MTKRSIFWLIIGIVLVVLGLFVGLTSGWDTPVGGGELGVALEHLGIPPEKQPEPYYLLHVVKNEDDRQKQQIFFHFCSSFSK